MDGKKAKEETSNADSTSDKPNGEVQTAQPEEQLSNFVVIDELSLPANKDADTESATKTKPATENKDNAKIDEKDADGVKETGKENDLNEVTSQDNEKNGDSLILTADEDLEPVVSSPKKSVPENSVSEIDEAKENLSEETAVPNTDGAETEDSKSAPQKPPAVKNQRVIWVSNISKSIKATDLKQYLSKAGKVTTAKIVTDGKRCFGYVLMDNAKDANECINTLNNTDFDGKKISLSFSKPTKVDQKDKTSETRPIAKKPRERSEHQRVSDAKRRRVSSSKQDAETSNRSESKTETDTPKAEGTDEKKVKSRSRSRERYLRERSERERLKRRLLIEERRNHEAKLRQIEMDERQREKEFKLEQERRKLQMEREFFEKQKREWARINDERRKLERARFEVEQQRAKLEEDLKKDRLKRKSPDMIPSSIVSKLEPSKKSSKMSKRDDFKNSYDHSAPPPPKLGADFDHGIRSKVSERKMERVGGRKIEVIDRKYYGESTDRKKHYDRKPEFDESKQYMKRYPSEREDEHRTQWSPPISYGSAVGSSAVPRYQDAMPSQPFGGGPSRASGYYYHPSASTAEFQRYDQLSSRKY